MKTSSYQCCDAGTGRSSFMRRCSLDRKVSRNGVWLCGEEFLKVSPGRRRYWSQINSTDKKGYPICSHHRNRVYSLGSCNGRSAGHRPREEMHLTSNEANHNEVSAATEDEL
ncbi:hypothetical protein NPIL_487561 [Nephila pilipes]|uniref:Uncharacterized protein n=1 Tax=Nephila pilipes TaxID=299642 RepID=A0A8X6Q0G2_NEPPI|nr:hypothetical protein NPIL_487561 [Nephila pilipes]